LAKKECLFLKPKFVGVPNQRWSRENSTDHPKNNDKQQT